MTDPSPTYTQTVEIVNTRGLHARAAAKLVKCAENTNADVTIRHNDMAVNGQSIMGLLMLGAGMGKHITVSATGLEAEKAVKDICDLIADKFGEDI